MRSKIYWIFTLTILLVSNIALANNNDSIHKLRIYTNDKPLVYEDAYNQWPYSFINDEGEPDGFNIDVVKLVLGKLNIPYEIRLTHPNITLEDLKKGNSDLTLAIYSNYNKQYGTFGQAVVSLMTHSIASPLSNPTRIKKFEDIKGNRIIVNTNSVCHQNLINADIEECAIPHDDMPEAVMQISTADSGQVLWNTMSLKYIINKYHLSNLHITPIQMDNDEFRFLANDTILLGKLDSLLQNIKANEELYPIRNKWFYPESHNSGIPHYIWYIAVTMIIIAIILILSLLLHRIRLKTMSENIKRRNKRLALFMRSGHIRMWTYNTEQQLFYTYEAESNKPKDFTPDSFSKYFVSDDFKKILDSIKDIENGKYSNKTLMVRCHSLEENANDNIFTLNISALKSDSKKTSLLLGTLRNITNEHVSLLTAKDLQQRYRYVFDTSMADMMYFDCNGMLTDINEKACETFGIANRKDLINDGIHLDDIIGMCETEFEPSDKVWITTVFNLDRMTDSNKMKKHVARRGTVYYELRMLTIRDDDGKQICVLLSAIDISETTNAIKTEKRKTNIIETTTRRISDYVNSINNAMSISNIKIANYYPDSRMLTIKQNLNKKRVELSQVRCLEFVDPSEYGKVGKLLKLMDKRKAGIFTVSIKTKLKDNDGRDCYLQLNFVPIIDNDNRISHYFGLCRDISELTETEARLKEEMEKAQETELLKTSFMSNMSHDIRTPLNSIVGFSELFNTEHSQEDETIFIEEIKKNTNILLKLINDILFLSRLDANMIEFKKEPCDVCTIFKAHCSMGWSSELNNNVTANIECTDNDMLLRIDGSQLGRIAEILARNAALYCKQGSITAKCEYIIDRLAIKFEDTGVGMPEEALQHVFDRYEQTDNVEQCGTKLGLAICKELAEQMGGHITLSSTLGKGTTIRVIIPCEKVTIKDAADNSDIIAG